jgi:phosphohistidine phosphatase SixA
MPFENRMNIATTRYATKMLILLTPIVAVLASLLLIALQWISDPSMARAAADENSYVILLRHGDAPGRSEPPGFDLNDCRTQRNLSDKGRSEARELGDLIRARNINVTKALTSRWCRTRETIELMKLGIVQEEPAFDNLEFNKQRATALLDGERKLIASWRGPGVLLVVTHQSNIKALTGFDLEQGAMIVAGPMRGSDTALRFGKILLKNASF